MTAEFIDVLEMEELDIGHSKKVLFTSDHFHTWVHGDYPGTKNDFNGVLQFAQTTNCSSPFGPDTTYCDTILK